MYAHFDQRSGQKAPLIADDVYDIIMKVSNTLIVQINSLCSQCINQFPLSESMGLIFLA